MVRIGDISSAEMVRHKARLERGYSPCKDASSCISQTPHSTNKFPAMCRVRATEQNGKF